MRIAYVTSHYPPSRGGIETHVGELARHARLEGHAVDVFTGAFDGAPTRECVDGIDVYRLRTWGPTSDLRVPAGLIKALRSRAGRYDIVHAHNYHAVPALLTTVSWRGPVVLTPHFHGGGHTALARVVHVPYRVAARQMFGRAALVICVTAAEERLLVATFPAVQGRTRVIANGVDIEHIQAAEPFLVERPVVVVVGRLDPYKRVDLVIRAFARLREDADLIVIGQGAQEPVLRQLVDDLGVGNRVRFLGGVSKDDLHQWLRTASVVVAMSLHEAFGLTIAEALTAGAVVVASDIPAHREVASLVEHDAVSLVPIDGDTAQIAVAIDERLRGPGTPVDTHGIISWSDVAGRTLESYRELI